jgi:hypothetical protein
MKKNVHELHPFVKKSMNGKQESDKKRKRKLSARNMNIACKKKDFDKF